MEILYKSKTAIVINKPFGMPSQPDKSEDRDAMSETSRLLRECGERDELYIINRLDRVVGGLMLFARSKKSAAMLTEALGDGRITKRYKAVVEGRASFGRLKDYICKDSRLNRAVITPIKRINSKIAELEYKTVDFKSTEYGERSLVEIELITGRFHQIRAQFSSRGLAVLGDKKYGAKDRADEGIALMSSYLCFPDGEEIKGVQLSPDRDKYPWNLF